MKQYMKCPLCKEELYSELGKGCKMCGMILTNPDDKFCSELCKSKYKLINRINKNGKRIN